MVHGRAFAGGIVDGFQKRIFREVGGQDEAAIDIRARGGDGEPFGRLQDQVGWPEFPALIECARRRHVGRDYLRSARVGPGR